MQVIGTIVKKHGKETKGQNNFTFERVWLRIDETSQYPQTIELQAAGQKANLFDNYPEGATVTVDVNLRGNEYNGKIYNQIQAWRVSGQTETDMQSQAISSYANRHLSPSPQAPSGGGDYSDQMPF